MNADRFLEELPRLFEDFPTSVHPIDRRFAPIADEVENLARENNLALLNLSAACLEGDEAYVEVGVFHGASLIAAMLGNEDKRFVGIDSLAFRDASLEKVEANLARYGLARPELLVGDAFELVPSGALADTRIGVWYYDAAHSYEAQVEGLRIAEPLLAPGALVIVDDTDWDDVDRAMDDYLAEQPQSAANPHDRRQVTRCPSVVGGDASARLGRRGGGLGSDSADRQLAIEENAVRVVQRERRCVAHALRDAVAAETESGSDRAVSKERRALLADRDQATRPEHTPGHPDGRADSVVRAIATDVQSDERRRRTCPERVDGVSRIDRSRGPAEGAGDEPFEAPERV